jgi:hypothetical protein
VGAVDGLGDRPLYVLSATEHGTRPAQEQLWQGWQAELPLLSANSVHQVVTGADHAAFWLDPATAQISVDAIRQVVAAASSGEALAP